MLDILIVEDEPLARARLKRLLGMLPECKIVAEAGNAQSALEYCAALKPDVMFLDIAMPGISGVELAERMQGMDEKPAIIFCTAYADKAAKAFDLEAVDYLVKPVRLERLQAAIRKVRQYLHIPLDADSKSRFLRSKVGERTELISIEDVYYLQAEDKYTTVVYAGGEAVIDDSLKSLLDEYPEHFLRIHRNALVARHRIRGLKSAGASNHYILLEGIDGAELKISRRNLPLVRKFIKAL